MEHKYIKLAWIFCGECCLCRDVYDKGSKNFNKMAKERMKYAVGWCETDFTHPMEVGLVLVVRGDALWIDAASGLVQPCHFSLSWFICSWINKKS